MIRSISFIKTESDIEYIESTLLVKALYVKIGDTFTPFEQAINSNIITYDDIASIDDIKYYNVSLFESTQLLSAILTQKEYLAIEEDIEEELEISSNLMTFNNYESNESIETPFLNWPEKIEWKWTMNEYYSLLA